MNLKTIFKIKTNPNYIFNQGFKKITEYVYICAYVCVSAM